MSAFSTRCHLQARVPIAAVLWFYRQHNPPGNADFTQSRLYKCARRMNSDWSLDASGLWMPSRWLCVCIQATAPSSPPWLASPGLRPMTATVIHRFATLPNPAASLVSTPEKTIYEPSIEYFQSIRDDHYNWWSTPENRRHFLVRLRGRLAGLLPRFCLRFSPALLHTGRPCVV